MEPKAIKRRLEFVLDELETQEATIKATAYKMGIAPEEMLNRDGDFVMVAVLLAQAQALSALQLIQESEKRAGTS